MIGRLSNTLFSLLFALCSIGFSTSVFSQNSRPNHGVSSRLTGGESKVESRFKQLLDRCEKLETEGKYAIMLDSARFLSRQAESVKNVPYIVQGYLKVASALRRLTKLTDSKTATDKARRYLTGTSVPSELHSKVATSYSIIYKALGKPDSSLIFGLSAIEIDSTLHLKGLANSYNNAGLAHMDLGNYLSAINFFHKGLELAEIDNQARVINRCTQNLGTCYNQIGEYNLARKYHLLNFENQKKTANKESLAMILGNLGSVEFNDKQLVKAINYYKESLNLAKEVNSIVVISGACINLAHLYLLIAEPDSALTFATEGVKLVEGKNLHEFYADARIALGKCYQKKSLFQKAKDEFLEAEAFSKKYQNVNTYEKACASMLELGEQSGDFKLAYQYSFKLRKLADSLENENNKRNIQTLEYQFQTEKKDKEIAQQKLDLTNQNLLILEKVKALEAQSFSLLLQKEATKKESAINELLLAKNQNIELELDNKERALKQQSLEALAKTSKLELEKKNQELENKQLKDALFRRNSIIGGGFLVFLIIGLAVNSVRLRRRLELQNAILDQRKRLSADLHDDVGATLSSISIYTEAIKNKLKNNEPERVMELVDKIGENSRETISNLGDIVWNLNPINDSAEKLFNRMESTATQLLTSQNTRFEFDVDPSLIQFEFSLEAKQNLYLIFKEIINNAAKYARASLVRASIRKNDNQLEINISDDGTGFDVSRKSERNGLRNIRLRAESLGGKTLLSSSENGTVFKIQFPIVALGQR